MKWTVTGYGLEDLPAVARFFKREYKGTGVYGGSDLFHWKVRDNPLMPGIINLVKDGERIAATTSVTPKRLFVAGREIAAAEIGDSYTDSAYQRQGMFAMLTNQTTQEALAQDMQFVYATPNLQSLPGFEAKANYLRVPTVHLRSLALPIHVAPLLQRKTHWLIAHYAGVIASTLVFVGLTAQRLMSGAVAIAEVSEIPDDWDEFWQSCLGRYDFLFARDKAAMEWRYFRHPYTYRVFVARSQGRIVGYAVCRVVNADGYSSFGVADYLFRAGEEHLFRSVLVHIADIGVRAGVALMHAWCPAGNPHFRVFRQVGFVPRGHVPVIAFQNDVARQVGERTLSWHFTLSDSDNI